MTTAPRARHGRQHRQGAEQGLGLCRATTSAPSSRRPTRARRIVKVIFENCFLQDEHKEKLCRDLRRGRGRLRQDLDRLRRTGATDEDLS